MLFILLLFYISFSIFFSWPLCGLGDGLFQKIGHHQRILSNGNGAVGFDIGVFSAKQTAGLYRSRTVGGQLYIVVDLEGENGAVMLGKLLAHRAAHLRFYQDAPQRLRKARQFYRNLHSLDSRYRT